MQTEMSNRLNEVGVPKGKLPIGRPRRVKAGPSRTTYILRGDDGNDYLVRTAEGYCNRRRLSAGRYSSIKKLQRMKRVRNTGYQMRPATIKEVQLYGPPINVSEE